MHPTCTHQSAAFTLEWSLALEPVLAPDAAPRVKLEYQLAAREDLYVSDRLWDYDRDARRIPDPYGIYRFVHQRSLRLLFWPAPRPHDIEFRVVYAPLFSLVRGGGIHHGEVFLELPVDEYSSFARDVDSPTEVVAVTRATLVMGVRLRSELKANPKPPLHEKAEASGYVLHSARRIVSSTEIPPLPVRRRMGAILRPLLPGDI